MSTVCASTWSDEAKPKLGQVVYYSGIARGCSFTGWKSGCLHRLEACGTKTTKAPRFRRAFALLFAEAYFTMLNRCTVRWPFTVMFTKYTPLAMSPGNCRMVLKRSPLLPNSWANTCLP